MTNDKGILIRNIYYMLTYAFQALRQTHYQTIAPEDFHDVYDLFAEILSKGIAQLLKQGLHREYISKTENLCYLRGKLEINGCVRNRIQQKHRLFCEYDELSENHIYHQILKTTALKLIQLPDVDKVRKKALQNLMPYFAHVETLAIRQIRWDQLLFHRNNQNYEMLMNLCRFVLESWLQSTDSGCHKMMMFSDDQMAKVYEKFILAYFNHHRSELGLTGVKAMEIPWKISECSDNGMRQILPKMRTDITLCKGKQTLIIDAKYYTHILSSHYERQTARSAHLYQLYAYVNNYARQYKGDVSGLLLYAKTQDEEEIHCHCQISNHRFGIQTLDLNQPFEGIKAQLNAIANEI